MRFVPACFLVLLAGCRDEAAPPESAPADHESAIRACYDGYKAAILGGDGDAAVERVTASTVAYYDRILDRALHASADETRKLPFMERLNVVSMRARIAPDLLRTMDGRKLFAHAVDIGLVSKDSVAPNELGEVTVVGDNATGEHIYGGRSAGVMWRFRREEGAWRKDLLSILPIATSAFEKIIADAGITEDEFILGVVEEMQGSEPTDAIWEPVGR